MAVVGGGDAVTTLAVSASGGRALWYLTRGTGTVTLILLTLSMVLGIVDVQRWRSERWPRFVVDALHRRVSLLVLAVLAVHVVTSVLDGFAPISLLDAVIPFGGSYRPLWLGLGALSLDVLVAVAVTSVLRKRVGQRAWRIVHWTAYACWPLAIVHGLGTGTDTPIGWMLVLTVACILAVLVCAAARAAAGWPARPRAQAGALAALAVAPLLLAVWLAQGPLAKGWARRSGTPTELLAATRSAAASGARPAASSGGAAGLSAPFQASVSGPVAQGTTAGGDVAVDVALALDGPGSRRLHLHIQGPPAQGGGVAMTSSSVILGTSAAPRLYVGSVSSLNGNQLLARVSSAAGRALDLQVTVAVDAGGGQASGTVSARPVGGGG
jgi:sulfoxide reductase heme-binding subunit YedZ